MKLKELTIAGFRGFNVKRTLEFHGSLTLISAPNSHGKTSISEALEFLLYGTTSKVAKADSKEEYKDSYRNAHFPSTDPACIEATFAETDDTGYVLRIELDTTGETQRFLNGEKVSNWPFANELAGATQPFILQHALKYLLLVPPNERFQGFAKLLSLDDIDALQRAIVNLCTKPEASIPPEGKRAITFVESLEARIQSFPDLLKLTKGLTKSTTTIDQLYTRIEKRADALLPNEVNPAERLTQLIKTHQEISSKIYSGSVALRPLAPIDANELQVTSDSLRIAIDEEAIKSVGALAVADVTSRLQKEAKLIDLGRGLLEANPEFCPLCLQPLTNELREHIVNRHEKLATEISKSTTTEDRRTTLARLFQRISKESIKLHDLLVKRSSQLILSVSSENASKVEALFGREHKASWETVQEAATSCKAPLDTLTTASDNLQTMIKVCIEALQQQTLQVGQIEDLGKSVDAYLAAADHYAKILSQNETILLGPSRILQQAIDAMAGSAEFALLIELIEKRREISRSIKVRETLDGLKELKKHVEQTIGEIMEAAISTDLTGSVMDWYGKIRTKGDPDVHFSNFAMERTKTGDFKSKRVRVNAKSYGVELASAVSSLSESKLNALGLCVSIASALRAPGPWGFLVLDDPIQSWDDEHETQFIEVVRSLVEEHGKQIILLSHKPEWIQQVNLGCRSLNGVRYQITGYSKDGPYISALDWAPLNHRLREAQAIIADPTASDLKVQQAEEEIRLAACQIVGAIAKSKLSRETNTGKMNGQTARVILLEAGCPQKLTDRTIASFGISDEAHHASPNYRPNVQRVRESIGTLNELKQLYGIQ